MRKEMSVIEGSNDESRDGHPLTLTQKDSDS